MTDDANPFHEGQRAVQKIAGEEAIAMGRIPMLKDSIAGRAARFLENQIQIIIGTEDINDRLWLSLLIGELGFIRVPSPKEVVLDLDLVRSTDTDIFYSNIVDRPTVGLLFHEGMQRSRYRAWGTAVVDNNKINIGISLGYPSCPKHIQREDIKLVDEPAPKAAEHVQGELLGDAEKAWITSAHTFFIGTQSSNGDTEASHRGGDPGFVEIIDGDVLRFPDYLGNSMFSTLGNIYQNPKTALLFVDYAKGEVLQISGTAALEFDKFADDDKYKSGDTGRFVTFKTDQWIRTRYHHHMQAEFVDAWRNNVITKRN